MWKLFVEIFLYTSLNAVSQCLKRLYLCHSNFTFINFNDLYLKFTYIIDIKMSVTLNIFMKNTDLFVLFYLTIYAVVLFPTKQKYSL